MTSEDLDKLWDFQHPDHSEQSFRDLLTNPTLEPSYRAEILTQIARAQGLQSNFTAAHQTLDEAESLLDSQPSRPRARSLLERGRLHNSAGSPESAKRFFLAALELATEIWDDFNAIDAAHMLGIIGTPKAKSPGTVAPSNSPTTHPNPAPNVGSPPSQTTSRGPSSTPATTPPPSTSSPNPSTTTNKPALPKTSASPNGQLPKPCATSTASTNPSPSNWPSKMN